MGRRVAPGLGRPAQRPAQGAPRLSLHAVRSCPARDPPAARRAVAFLPCPRSRRLRARQAARGVCRARTRRPVRPRGCGMRLPIRTPVARARSVCACVSVCLTGAVGLCRGRRWITSSRPRADASLCSTRLPSWATSLSSSFWSPLHAVIGRPHAARAARPCPCVCALAQPTRRPAQHSATRMCACAWPCVADCAILLIKHAHGQVEEGAPSLQRDWSVSSPAALEKPQDLRPPPAAAAAATARAHSSGDPAAGLFCPDLRGIAADVPGPQPQHAVPPCGLVQSGGHREMVYRERIRREYDRRSRIHMSSFCCEARVGAEWALVWRRGLVWEQLASFGSWPSLRCRAKAPPLGPARLCSSP